MAEEWRRKTYYKPRVLIPVDECLDSAFGDCLVCLTGGQLNLVRNLLLYAERRSTFVSEYEPNTYLAPTTEEWDDLQEMVADLEGNLMDCEQFTSDLQEILDWVRQQGSLTPGPFTEDEETAFPYDDVVGDDELTPAEEDACDVAQLWFEWGYQVITEHVLPATRWGFDYLVPAVAGFIALAIGGPPAAMGVYALAELIQELLEIFYRGAETNLVNWMTTNKEDIVCVLFSYLVLGGDASDMWAAAYAAVVEPAEDISAGDKLILSLFMGSWAGSNALKAFDAETEWATSNVEAGYCDECDPYGPTGLFWRPDSTCWYDNGEGWTKYWVPADPVETVPAEYAQEIKWQPDTLNNLTVHLHDEEDDPAGELIWRMRVYDEHGTFGQFFTGHNLTGISHAQELKEVSDSPWDWDDMNWCNMARDGQWGFAYTVNPDHHVSFDIIG